MCIRDQIHHFFLQTHFHRWLESVVLEIPPEMKPLLELIFNAGAETLFNVDVFRQTRDSKSEDPIFDAVKPISNSSPQVLSCLPRLFTSYVQVIRKYRVLFSTGVNQLPGTVIEELQAFGMCFFTSSKSLLDTVASNAQTWSISVALLRLVNQEALYNRNEMDASVLRRIIESALEILSAGWNGNYSSHFVQVQ